MAGVDGWIGGCIAVVVIGEDGFIESRISLARI